MTRDVEFQDVYYTVKESKGIFSFKEKKLRNILKGVSGVFKNGKMSAIMGPSGAGKSSLLNAICGATTTGVSGTIKINRKTSCYITQQDIHRKMLNIRELMELACSLKLKANGEYFSSHEQLILEILGSLNLSHRQTVTADRLSGGEKKRLSIALELVANPNIFFLDEPTSGLDEVTAVQCIRLLKDLAKQGRTVVCTIHQPSAAIFGLFDEIYVLSQGVCVFQGTPQSLVPLLSHLNLVCPNYFNPADYIIELCDSDVSTVAVLNEFIQNGKLFCSHITDAESELGFNLKAPLTSMILDIPKPTGGSLLQKMKELSHFIRSDYAASCLYQFYILFKMMMLINFRNRTIFGIQLFHHLLCGGAIGLIFYNTADLGERMFEHLKYCMGVIFFVVYTQVMVPILSYPQEVKCVKKEYFNRWYSLFPYYSALTLSRIPLQIFLNLIFLSLVYFLCGLPLQLWRFSLFVLITLVTSLVAEGMGLWIGATFSITNGCAVGPMFIAPFLGLAIYGFDFAKEIPALMNFFMKFSFIRGGVVSLVITVFGFDRNRLNCDVIYCQFDDPKALLKYLDIDRISLYSEISILCGIMIFFRFLCYVSLKKRFHT